MSLLLSPLGEGEKLLADSAEELVHVGYHCKGGGRRSCIIMFCVTDDTLRQCSLQMPETSPITPDHSPLPPLPTEPPPPVSPVGSPMSPGLPAASPVTPPDQAPGSPALPPMQTGAFMDDTASDDSHQGEALLAPKSVPGMVRFALPLLMKACTTNADVCKRGSVGCG